MSILVQEAPISLMTWHPLVPALFILTNSGSHVYCWQADGCRCLPLPEASNTTSMLFRENGVGELLVSNPKSFCLAFPEWISSSAISVVD